MTSPPAPIEAAEAGVVQPPYGWTLVPVEPDEGMINEAIEHCFDEANQGPEARDLILHIWDRMLAYAPNVPDFTSFPADNKFVEVLINIVSDYEGYCEDDARLHQQDYRQLVATARTAIATLEALLARASSPRTKEG